MQGVIDIPAEQFDMVAAYWASVTASEIGEVNRGSAGTRGDANAERHALLSGAVLG